MPSRAAAWTRAIAPPTWPPSPRRASIIPLVVLASIGSADWISGLVIVCTLPLVPLSMALIGRYTERDTRRRWQPLAALSGHFLDVVSGLTTLKVFGRSRAQA